MEVVDLFRRRRFLRPREWERSIVWAFAMYVSRVLVAAILIVTLACSGGGNSNTAPMVTAPTSPGFVGLVHGTRLTFTSAENGQPVAGTSVTISGQSSTGSFTVALVSDSQGQITVDRDVLLSPRPELQASAIGFLERRTLIREMTDIAFSLWPTTSTTGLDESLTSTLVYSSSTCPAVSTGLSLMRRLPSSVKRVTVTFGATLQDAAAQSAHVFALSRLNLALAGATSYVFVTETTAADTVVFTADINPNAPTCSAGSEPFRASTSVTTVNGEVVGGHLTYCTVEAARSTGLVLHELGHTSGLYHSAQQQDVMYCTTGRPSVFSLREMLAMKLVRQRRSGNRFPDDDRLVTTSLVLAPGEITVQCGGRPGD